MDTFRTVHVATEVLVISAVTVYLNNKIKGLEKEVAELKQVIIEQDKKYSDNFSQIVSLINKTQLQQQQQARRSADVVIIKKNQTRSQKPSTAHVEEIPDEAPAPDISEEINEIENSKDYPEEEEEKTEKTEEESDADRALREALES